MFVDHRDAWPPEPWTPAPLPAQPDPRRERAILRAVGLLLAAVTLAPIGGATLVEFVAYLLG